MSNPPAAQRSIGIILLCLYLMVVGLLLITNIKFQFDTAIEGVLAIGAAIFLALGR